MNKKTVLVTALAIIAVLSCVGGAGWSCRPVNAHAIAMDETPKISAKSAFLMEANSGETLFGKEPDKRLPVASMTKIATLAVIYDALDEGVIKLDDKTLVSTNASSMGGSQAFLDGNTEYPIRDLVRSIVVSSANDSSVAMAEALYGSEGAFVGKMNELAKRLGCANTNFANSTGLPAANGYSTAHDMALMYRHIMKSPHFANFNSDWMYDLVHPSGRITGLTNTNKLIRFYSGCTGGKTGFTTEAGHCITVTATRGDIRPIAVIIGAADSQTRFRESVDLMNYAFDGFENKLIVDKNTAVGVTKLRGAVAGNAEVFAADSFYKLTRRGQDRKVGVTMEIPKRANAPVRAGEPLGKIIITEQGKVIREIPVTVNHDIARASYFDTVKKVVSRSSL